MKKTSSTTRVASAESIARRADKGEDVSSHFTNKGKLMPPLNDSGIEVTDAMLKEVDRAARKLKVTRQALIKRFIRRGLDERYGSPKRRKVG